MSLSGLFSSTIISAKIAFVFFGHKKNIKLDDFTLNKVIQFSQHFIFYSLLASFTKIKANRNEHCELIPV